jgi:hypothetical protein
LILSTWLRLGLPSGLFPSGFPTNVLYAFLFSPVMFDTWTYKIESIFFNHFVLFGTIVIIHGREVVRRSCFLSRYTSEAILLLWYCPGGNEQWITSGIDLQRVSNVSVQCSPKWDVQPPGGGEITSGKLKVKEATEGTGGGHLKTLCSLFMIEVTSEQTFKNLSHFVKFISRIIH